MFYVYEWYVKNTGEIFYVGKGSGNRYKVAYQRNALFTEMIEKYDCESRVIKQFENEKDAFDYEKERINQLKAIGLCKCNIHSGGAGGSSEYWTDKLREEYSQFNVMKRPEQRKRMSENNPMKNKETAQKVAEKKQRKVIINGVEYKSVKQAQQHYGVCYDTISNWCKKGINYYDEPCKFADEEGITFTDKRYNKGSSKAVIYKGKIYQSTTDFCDDIKISMSTARNWLNRGFNPDGEPCRRLDDTRELVYEDRRWTGGRREAKPVIVNNIKYKSCEQAANALNIRKATLYSYLRGDTQNPNYICTYDNQQPS